MFHAAGPSLQEVDAFLESVRSIASVIGLPARLVACDWLRSNYSGVRLANAGR